jgi:uncharacterized protein
MILEGVVTNVTNFGAFVDIGVHQDGLVHISALAERFVKDPREVVKAGDVVKVKVLEVDVPRKRIALTMRLSDSAEKPVREQKARNHEKPVERSSNKPPHGKIAAKPAGINSAMADALARALKK